MYCMYVLCSYCVREVYRGYARHGGVDVRTYVRTSTLDVYVHIAYIRMWCVYVTSYCLP